MHLHVDIVEILGDPIHAQSATSQPTGNIYIYRGFPRPHAGRGLVSQGMAGFAVALPVLVGAAGCVLMAYRRPHIDMLHCSHSLLGERICPESLRETRQMCGACGCRTASLQPRNGGHSDPPYDEHKKPARSDIWATSRQIHPAWLCRSFCILGRDEQFEGRERCLRDSINVVDSYRRGVFSH